MAKFGFSRRRILRLINIRSALLGVPLVWLLFIWWTIYYTQSMEHVQSRRQSTLPVKQSKYNDLPPHEDHKVAFSKSNEMHFSLYDYPREKMQAGADAEYPNLNDVAKVANLSDKIKYNNDKSNYQNKNDNNAGNQGAHLDHQQANEDRFGVSKAVHDFVAYMHQSRKETTPTGRHSISSGQYFEFVWKGDKPKPAKKFIIPGSRFDPPKLGEYGRSVKINPDNLNSRQRQKFEEGWKNYKFNEYASIQISTQRATPDFRPDGCKRTDPIPNLQKASIIICFYNEAWSVLLRTIHSVLNRSPPELIEEIILVDDYSDIVMMGEPLEYYVTQVNKLRLLRMTKRSGLVQARLAGVAEAKGPILIFLDSHVECEEDWLPPLLQTILQNPNFAVTPEIDVIDHKDFSIHAAVDNIGVLTFEGFQFDWSSIMPRIKRTRKSMADPIKSPAMAGGLFAIKKDYFLSIGTYDSGLEVWGGENIELSLKLWMCGGGILIHPCSRVAHVFRDDSPYLINKAANVLVKNSARVAQVWADEYRDLYFKEKPYDEHKFGSVQERQELRKRLQCHSFSWYLENVYPEMYIAGSGHYLGKITSVTGLCIDKPGFTDDSLLILVDCKTAHEWEATRIKEIRSVKQCIDIKIGTSQLVIQPCDLENKSQIFEYEENKSIYHPISNSCITASSVGSSLTLHPCNKGSLQTWTWPLNDQFIPVT